MTESEATRRPAQVQLCLFQKEKKKSEKHESLQYIQDKLINGYFLKCKWMISCWPISTHKQELDNKSWNMKKILI